MNPQSPQLTPWTRLKGWRAAGAWAFVLAAALRVGLGLAMGVTWQIVKPNLAPGLLDNPAVYGDIGIPTTFPADALLGVWPRWDAIHHLNLALQGYSGVSEGDTVFYFIFPTSPAAFQAISPEPGFDTRA